MPKKYPTDLIQPAGNHNPKYECVKSEEVKDYISVSYPYLNPLQSDFIQYLEDDDTNIVVSAPTSSGKTLCAELFTARAIKQGKRVLYIAPMKALTDEKYYEWTNIGHSLSTNNIEILTGDFQLNEAKKNALNKADIIFLTPEMFNSKCRYYPSNSWLHNSVIITDECFPAETLIWTGNENRLTIEEVYNSKDITHVMSFNHDSLQYGLEKRKILRKIRKEFNGKDLIKINYVNSKGEFDNLICTRNHKIYVEGKDYIRADEIKKDDVLIRTEEHVCQDGVVCIGAISSCIVIDFEIFDDLKTKYVYTLEVEGNHNYIANNILVSNCHLIGSNARGDKLEIGLIQYFENSPNSRALLLSATIPNVDDFSKFVQHNTKRETIFIKNPYRPCQLIEAFIPFSDTSVGGSRMSYEQREISRLEKVIELVNKNKKESTLIFVGSKEFGRKLSERLEIYAIKHHFHNADLDREARNKIENEFRTGVFNVLIATSTLSWGINSPAVHVILSHTAFGLTEMDPSDINQAKGRAGRFGYSDKGYAHILVPKKDMEKEKRRLGSDYEIKSVLNDINIMTFHIISYIDNGHIKTAEELYNWHEKTLASIQKARYGIEVFSIRSAQNVLDNLENRRMIKKDDEGNYSTTEIGQITARMYMSPLDVSDWFSNFSKISAINPSSGASPTQVDALNTSVALALGHCYSWSNPAKVYISKAEQRTRTVVEFAQKLINEGKLSWDTLQRNPYIKYASVFYALLKGETVDTSLQSIVYGMQQDFPRIISTMKQIDERYGKYHKKQGLCKGFDWGESWTRLLYRLRYPGISEHLWDLVSIDGIGLTFAKKLYGEGIKSKKDFENPLNGNRIRDAIGEKRAEKIFSELGVSSIIGPKVKKTRKTTKKAVEEDNWDKVDVKGLF